MKTVSTALLAALLSAAALGLSACGGTSGDEIDKARKEGAEQQQLKDKQAEQTRKQRELEKKIKQLEKDRKNGSDSSSSSGSGGGTTTGSTSCGGGLSVNSNTSCAFAENVRAELNYVGGSPATIYVYSPTTGATYTMRCTGGAPTVCRGGNSAAVYIR